MSVVGGLHGPVGPTGLRGRARECAQLDDLVAAINRGESRSLVLRGEAGIGKTALLEHMVASAPGAAVIRAVGVESDMELAYASLHQLCGPLLDRLDRLPVPQRQALKVVFGLCGGDPPDRFLVGLAVLSLFAETSEERPLLCVVDDAQWLDRASGLTLAFVARRLLAEPVGIVFAAREPGEELRNLPELEVHGIRNGDARALLASAVRFKLDDQVRDRIVAETRGNPLALLELPRRLTATQLAGEFTRLGEQPLAGQIEDSFVQRMEALTDDERRLVLLAAAEPTGDPLLLWRAAERLEIGPDAAAAAEADGLLAVDVRVAFRHPLVRSAVYRSAPVDERRAIHLALAEATDRETDPDRRAWHLAAAAPGPDEHVASELERSAGRAQARGGFAAAAAFGQRASTLTPDPARRAERALTAAQASLQAGAFDAALGLVASAEAGPLDEPMRARAEVLRAQVAFISFRAGDAPKLLLKAARRFEPIDLNVARDTYLTAWGAALVASEAEGLSALMEICDAVQSLPPSKAPRPLDVLLDGFVQLLTQGHGAAMPTFERAATALADMPVGDVRLWGWIATCAPAIQWDIEGMRAFAEREIRLLRDAGAFAALPSSLANCGIATVWTGDFAGAAALIEENDSVAAATGTAQAPFPLLRLLALQGREADASAAIASTIDQAGSGQGMAAGWARWAASVLHISLGRYEQAAVEARKATSDPRNWWSMWALPELVEAASRAGDAQLAQEALDRLVETTEPCNTDAARGVQARCRALLSAGDAAEDLYRQAIDRLSRSTLRPELARAHLLYGEWLRGEKRLGGAREQLRTAHDMFVAIGMEAFAERARAELQAAGEKARRPKAKMRADLTAQERQIARLARDGLSNPEIGERLFVSPRTVEWHLRNVFSKLGVRSRHELDDALPPVGNPGT
jgi:DNA-binding CsgD family transcriptional regulator